MAHVPQKTIESTDVLTFQEALNDNYENWVYVPDCYCDYRYILGTKGKKPIIVIGANPSTAAPNNLDNTLKSVERIAHFNGYDSFLMFNVSAQRATSPKDMDEQASSFLHEQNLLALKHLLGITKDVWLAWGNIVNERDYLKDYVRDVIKTAKSLGATFFIAPPLLGTGNPHHPLYLPSTTRLAQHEPPNE